MGRARSRAVRRAGQRVTILLPRRIIPVVAGGPRGQRFFVLLRAPVFAALDLFRARPCVLVAALFALALRLAVDVFRPVPFGFAAARRPVATSSCRCSEPIMRPSDSADRSSSDSSSRDRPRDGYAGISFLAIQSPSRGPGALTPQIEQAAGQRVSLSDRRTGICRNCLKRREKDERRSMASHNPQAT